MDAHGKQNAAIIKVPINERL